MIILLEDYSFSVADQVEESIVMDVDDAFQHPMHKSKNVVIMCVYWSRMAKYWSEDSDGLHLFKSGSSYVSILSFHTFQ